jgi:hypothetical protein
MSTITEIPTTTRVTTLMKANHEINITLKNGFAVAPSSPSSPIIMAVGETVRYSSDAGEVRILFQQQSPFRIDDVTMTNVPGSVILTLVSGSAGGILLGDCFIKPPGGPEVGYDPKQTDGGVHHRVTPP